MDFVAEVGSAHKGSLSLAYEFVRRYAAAGATHIKFQFGWTREAQERMGLEYNPLRFMDNWSADIADMCRCSGVEPFASIWSIEGLQAAENVHLRNIKISTILLKKNPELAFYLMDRYPHAVVSGKNTFVISKYPVYPWELRMPERFTEQMFGYSDHSHGIAPCLLAIARGATYIEKHVALDKSDMTVKDTPFSATPEEFADMVRIGKEIARLVHG
jgi:sialic acid synthase SpsE